MNIGTRRHSFISRNTSIRFSVHYSAIFPFLFRLCTRLATEKTIKQNKAILVGVHNEFIFVYGHWNETLQLLLNIKHNKELRDYAVPLSIVNLKTREKEYLVCWLYELKIHDLLLSSKHPPPSNVLTEVKILVFINKIKMLKIIITYHYR